MTAPASTAEWPDGLALRRAGEQLDATDLFAPPTAAQRGELRLNTLHGWLRLMARLDAARDPDFDPERNPAPELKPPFDATASAQQRTENERAIAANERQAERARTHWGWQALNMELTDRAGRFIRRFYTASNADQGELADALAQAGTGDERRQRLGLALHRQ